MEFTSDGEVSVEPLEERNSAENDEAVELLDQTNLSKGASSIGMTTVELLDHFCSHREAPMKVVHYTDFRSHGEIPRSDTDVVVPYEDGMQVIFISHRWWGKDVPDFMLSIKGNSYSHHKYWYKKHRIICEGIERGLEDKSFKYIDGDKDVYLWIDYACIEQNDPEEKLKGIRSLVHYVSKCQAFLIPTLGMGYRLIHMSKDYGERAWCRLESFLFSVLAKIKHPLDPVQSFFLTNKRNGFAEYVYHDYNRPSKGEVTNEEDIKEILEIEAEVIRLMGYALVEQALAKFEQENSSGSINIVKQYLKDDHVDQLAKQLLDSDALSRLDELELDLSKNMIGPSGVRCLDDLSRMIVVLNLSENPIGSAGIETISNQLMHPECTLRGLFISSIPDFDQKAVNAIAEALKVNSSLRYLDLALNRIDGVGGIILCEALPFNNTLSVMDLRKNDIGRVGSKDMLRILHAASDSLNFNRLDLSINAIGSESKKMIEEFNSKNPKNLIICSSPEIQTRTIGSGSTLSRNARKRSEKNSKRPLGYI